jgi:hypothetical protein
MLALVCAVVSCTQLTEEQRSMTRWSRDGHDVRVAGFVVPPNTFTLARGGACWR